MKNNLIADNLISNHKDNNLFTINKNDAEKMFNKVLIITGPTAVGKSSIAIKCAELLNGEIISADSMQIYKELNIGTAKLSEKEQHQIKHYMINIKNFNEDYNVWQFVNDTKLLIKDIIKRKKTPIICGGTILYIKALIENYNFSNANYNKINNDENNCFQYKVFALNLDRNVLYDKINFRVDKMLQNGMLDEVKLLHGQGLNQNMQSGKSIGYRELMDYLDNKISYEFAVEKFKQHSRNYAKRQLTFIKTIKNVIWIDSKDDELAVKKIIENFNN